MPDPLRQQDSDERESAAGEDRAGAEGEARPGLLEWIVGALSLLAVAGMTGYILYQGLTMSAGAPKLQVIAGAVAAAGDGFRVEFRILNGGEATASAAVVEGQLRRGDEVLETSTATIDYVPGHSERSGGLIFGLDPAQYRLHLAPKGYADP